MATKIVCIYHGNCADGFTAAWAVRKALGDEVGGVPVEYVPGFYGTAPDIKALRGAYVVMVDFSYKAPVLGQIAAVAKGVLVLDHHVSAEKELIGLGTDLRKRKGPVYWARFLTDVYQDECEGAPQSFYHLFDMDRSGAQLAWDFFHPGMARPLLVDYVADRDLWRFKLHSSREINMWVFSHAYSWDNWSSLALCLADDFGLAQVQGEAILRKHRKDIRELLAVTARTMVIAGVRVPVANLPYTMASDAAHLMAEGGFAGHDMPPFAACYYDREDGKRVFSLRSLETGANVAALAVSYGGGGHANAAGFEAPLGWEGDE